ncbi:MAG: alkaline phosphatase family protein, partial [Gemmatimonadaceae bacterium]
MNLRSTRFALVLVALASGATQGVTAQQLARPAPASTAGPRLVVFLTVDQLLPAYFERYGRQLTGGLARLYRNGAVFTNGYQDHAITETAPGHASTLSGRFPRSTGIVTNATGVGDPQSSLIGGVRGAGASPYRFRGTTLIDWMRFKDPRSRALSVSRKDRGAILPLGRAKQHVYWFAGERFTTSTYYADTLPTWVQRFNARRTPQRSAGRAWTLLLSEASYPEPDNVPFEDTPVCYQPNAPRGEDVAFPHGTPTDTSVAARVFPNYPWMDEATLAFALDGVQALDLGRGPQPDLLAISLSTMDAVGHRYGPDSREVHDMFLRLDRYLGTFIDSLYRLRDSSTIAIALTADHGAAPYPEVYAQRQPLRVQRANIGPAVFPILSSVWAAGIDTAAFRLEQDIEVAMLWVDRDAFRRRGMDADSAIRAV